LCLWAPERLAADNTAVQATSQVATLQPAAPGASADPVVLYLDIAINQQAVGQLVQVLQRGTDFSMEADALRRMHVLNSEPPGSQVVINRLEGVSVHYDMLAQRLAISVPPEWLPLQRLSEDPPVETPTHAQSTGWLMNYDLYSTQAPQSAATSLWTEQRYFSPRGIGFNTGVARLRARPSSTNEARGYVRYDTRWTRTDMERATETLYGDIVSGALPWDQRRAPGWGAMGAQFSRAPRPRHLPVARVLRHRRCALGGRPVRERVPVFQPPRGARPLHAGRHARGQRRRHGLRGHHRCARAAGVHHHSLLCEP